MENKSGNWLRRHMEDVGPTQAIFSIPHGIFLLQFRIHGKPNCSWMSYKDNKIVHIYHRSNLEGNVAYMGEEESFWS